MYVYGLSQNYQCLCYALGIQSIVLNNDNCPNYHADVVSIPFLGAPFVLLGRPHT